MFTLSLNFLHPERIKVEHYTGYSPPQVQQGGYFGELALVNHNKRAATVAAKDDVRVACEFLIMMMMVILGRL